MNVKTRGLSATSAPFADMWSPHQNLGPGIGAWHPHMMVYAPYYENAMLGGNEFAGSMPFVSDDGGTPFAVVVIPVHGIGNRERQNGR